MLQRVKSASVTVDGELISTIGKGILVFAAVSKDDTEKDVESMAGKVLKLKMWDDEDGGRVSKLSEMLEALDISAHNFTGSGSGMFWISKAKYCVVFGSHIADQPCWN